MMPSFKSILLAGAVAMLPFGAAAHAAPKKDAKEAPVAEVVVAEPEQVEEEPASDFDSEAYAKEQKAKTWEVQSCGTRCFHEASSRRRTAPRRALGTPQSSRANARDLARDSSNSQAYLLRLLTPEAQRTQRTAG